MRIAYLGTGAIGVPSLEALHRSDAFDLIGVVTQPDRPAGRGRKMMASPVKAWALENSLPFKQPESINDPAVLSELASWEADVTVVCAFGQILKPPVLNWPKYGCLNIHASLLPRHRGASCIQAALLAGDRKAGVSVIQMEAGLDTGPVLGMRSVEMGSEETAASLHDRLADLAPDLLLAVLDEVRQGKVSPQVQDDSEASYAPKLSRQDGELDWTLSASELERRVRAFHSWPGTFTFFSTPDGRTKRLKIFPPVRKGLMNGKLGEVIDSSEGVGIICGEGSALMLSEVQPEGSRPMSAAEWLRGFPGGKWPSQLGQLEGR